MSSKEDLISALQSFRENEATQRQQSIFAVMDMQAQMDSVFNEITSWFSNVADITVEQAPMPQVIYRSSAFNPKQLRVNVANFQVTINPILRYETLAFNVVGLVNTDLLMTPSFQLTDWNESPVGSLTAEYMYTHLKKRVGDAS